MTTRRSKNPHKETEVLAEGVEAVPESGEARAAAPEGDAVQFAEGEVVQAVESGPVQLAEESPAEFHGGAAEAIRKGAASAQAAVGEFIPDVGRLVRRTVYGTFYYASFGVVFTALTVARLVPANNAMGEGLRDGALAARKAVAEEEHVAGTQEENAAEGHGPEAVPA